jgi:hypothetical protein
MWAIIAASVVLIVLGIHLAWERHRCRLVTPKGTIWVGMTSAEVRSVLGPPDPWPPEPAPWRVWFFDEGTVRMEFDDGGRLRVAGYLPHKGVDLLIPRPSLFEYVRSWFKREE